MAEVILVCGKVCSGKSQYSHRLKATRRAVVLSCDELMQTLYPDGAGQDRAVMLQRTRSWLARTAVRMVRTGQNVILDWGFWTAAEREDFTRYLRRSAVRYEWHYLDVSDSQWQTNIRQRGDEVDQDVLKACEASFEPPAPGEMDVIVRDRDLLF